MAVGQKVTYQDVQEIMEMIAPGVAFQVQDESQFLQAIGFPGRMGNTFDVDHNHMEKRLNANSATVVGAQAGGDTTIELVAGQGNNFRIGQILQADGSRELMRVVGPIVANEVEVARAHNTTPATAIADGETITRVAWPQVEKDQGGNPEANIRQQRDNFTQIFRGEICVSTSRKKVKNKGEIMDEVREQLTTLQRDKLRDLARASLVGKRSGTPRGDDTTPREMDGLIQLILDGATAPQGDPVIVNAALAPLDISLLDDLLGQCWERGGRPDALLMNTFQLERLAQTIEGRRRYTSTESKAGGRVNEFVSKHGGNIRVLPADIFVPNDIVLALDTRKLQIVKLGTGNQLFEVFEQGKRGTADEIVFEMEVTLEAKNAVDGGHGLLQGLARV
ncbi:hypothetical protein LCGC14_0273370 [marine sediment metagenome]|uniref:Uncharacterized protein n=2 Tax=root TaxID=1 RepID=A0A9C9NG39_9HYPH|nr:hypothetical protein [Aurantimonas coralicida]